MILLFALACTRSPPVEVSARRVASHELAITIRANQAVCLYDRTPLPHRAGGESAFGSRGGDKGPYHIPEFAHQVLYPSECRVHIQLGHAPAYNSGSAEWTLERCVPAGTTVERRVRLTDPLQHYRLYDWSVDQLFFFRPNHEIVVDVEYRLPHENKLVIHEEITLTTGERANLFVDLKKPYLESHWAHSEPIPVPDLDIASTDKPCSAASSWWP